MSRADQAQGRRMQKFRECFSSWQAGRLSQLEAAEVLGCHERTFRRYIEAFEAEGEAGLRDGRLGKPSAKAIAAAEREAMLKLYRERHRGWTAKHFHEHGTRHYRFGWSYTWTKTQLHTAGLLEKAPKRGAHRRKRERKPCEGMMLHQDGSRHVWLEGVPAMDLIVTMDDATSVIYSAFLIEEEGTMSTFRGLMETMVAHGIPSSLYTDRGSHYFYTPEAGGKVDKVQVTQVGRALQRLGVEHIPAYSPEARGRSERMFGTLQDRLVKELALAGIRDVAAANAWIEDEYIPSHNRQFATPPTVSDSAFVATDAATLVETLCIEETRVVERDNTVSYEGERLQIPESPVRAHYVKANVKVREYPDGGRAIFHGPRCIARFASDGGASKVPPLGEALASCSSVPRRAATRTARATSASPSATEQRA